MNIEEIKRKVYTMSQYATVQDLYGDMLDDISKLIAEVERLQEFEREAPTILYMQAYDKAEKKVAQDCARIAEMSGDHMIEINDVAATACHGIKDAIRKKYNLEG